MLLNESSLLYFENYYVLEQARAEVHTYLERIVTNLAEEAESYMSSKYNGIFQFRKFVQKNGGYADFTFESKEPIPNIVSIDRWKFSIVYSDAIKTEMISDPKNCIIYCFAPKSYDKQNYELSRIAAKLGLPEINRVVEFSLVGNSIEEVVAPIKEHIIERYEQFIQMVEALMKEGEY